MTNLEELQKQFDEATPGPWTADTGVRGDCVVWGPNGRFLMNMQAEPHWIEYPGEHRQVSFDVDARDARFIASARNNMGKLLDVVNQVRALRDEMQEATDGTGITLGILVDLNRILESVEDES